MTDRTNYLAPKTPDSNAPYMLASVSPVNRSDITQVVPIFRFNEKIQDQERLFSVVNQLLTEIIEEKKTNPNWASNATLKQKAIKVAAFLNNYIITIVDTRANFSKGKNLTTFIKNHPNYTYRPETGTLSVTGNGSMLGRVTPEEYRELTGLFPTEIQTLNDFRQRSLHSNDELSLEDQKDFAQVIDIVKGMVPVDQIRLKSQEYTKQFRKFDDTFSRTINSIQSNPNMDDNEMKTLINSSNTALEDASRGTPDDAIPMEKSTKDKVIDLFRRINVGGIPIKIL